MTDRWSTWNTADLFEPPAVFSEERRGDLTAIYYEGLPWRGAETRVFALVGIPKGASADSPVPGMVLVHGGGGTAFPDWVRHWTAQGFAAIAMDCCGCKGGGKHGDRPRHAMGGPPGYGGFDQMDEPVGDHWMTHAVAAVIRGHSLLRAHPGVEAARIGLTGVSWGGIVISIAGAVDSRFRFAVPVYGCGFLAEYGSGPGSFAEAAAKGQPELKERWKERWDPGHYLPRMACPSLWVNGTNDLAFSLPSVMLSSRAAAGPATLCFLHKLPHGHVEGWAPREIAAFARHHALGEPPLARILSHETRDGTCRIEMAVDVPIAAIERWTTTGTAPWRERAWEKMAMPFAGDDTVTIAIPDIATGCFVNLVDTRGLTVSSELVAMD